VPLCGSEEEVKKTVKFTLTGFSLGAALTDMGTAYLHQKGLSFISCMKIKPCWKVAYPVGMDIKMTHS
jgi:hypothetical protein